MMQENKSENISFANINIVLVNTSHPGNIGAVARAMKTMGLMNLSLVAPIDYPNKKAEVLAVKATDVLENAKIYENFSDAISDCQIVYGASSRLRVLPQDVFTVRDAAKKIMTTNEANKIAIVFGREDSGLTNEELQKCQYHLYIPANPAYSALNLAQAVQVCCYELRMASKENLSPENKFLTNLPAKIELEKLYQHIEQTMIAINFLNPKNPRRMMPRLRRIFTRANIDKDDVDLLHGMMSAVDRLIHDK